MLVILLLVILDVLGLKPLQAQIRQEEPEMLDKDFRVRKVQRKRKGEGRERRGREEGEGERGRG